LGHGFDFAAVNVFNVLEYSINIFALANTFNRASASNFVIYPRFSIRPDAVDKTTQPVRLR
jgi:hypothetical protein